MKYSKQRETILNIINESYEHPTANIVYNQVRKTIPNISLGTVYRNLNQLYENGLINKIKMPDDSDRFDKKMVNHCHLFCTNCNMIFDIPNSILSKVNNLVENETKYKIISDDIVFTGICKNCQ